jgi:hypothetical protein
VPALMTELGVVLRLLDRLASRPLVLPLFATGGMASGGVVRYSVNALASAVVAVSVAEQTAHRASQHCLRRRRLASRWVCNEREVLTRSGDEMVIGGVKRGSEPSRPSRTECQAAGKRDLVSRALVETPAESMGPCRPNS